MWIFFEISFSITIFRRSSLRWDDFIRFQITSFVNFFMRLSFLILWKSICHFFDFFSLFISFCTNTISIYCLFIIVFCLIAIFFLFFELTFLISFDIEKFFAYTSNWFFRQLISVFFQQWLLQFSNFEFFFKLIINQSKNSMKTLNN